eukprot:TRINITY_DN1099_c0_g1_i1.p1 TRINITY_DN1099_c0_g1~~TRINITY_DN1099_c0_g1_i1.p1  ORF type:complete len:555 (+),score=92.33 TRINITY_DN1099_c0_g1_i1:107-1771(+)
MKAALLLGILISVALSQTNSYTFRGLGTNIDSISDYSSTNWALVDVFKTARPWISGACGGTWDDGRQITTDANGWVSSLLSNQCVRSLFLTNTPDAPLGEWIMTFDGEGTIDFGGLNGTTTKETSNRIKIFFNSPGLFFSISSINTANYIRNIKVIHSSMVGSTDIWHPTFLNGLNYFSQIRYMDLQRTNGNGHSEWSDRARLTDATWSTTRGVPVEALVDLTNRLNIDPWFCMPVRATDDYVLQYATYVKQHLNTGLIPYVELSNEVWNWGFEQAQYALQQAQKNASRYGSGSGEWMKWYSSRAVEVHKIWENVFGAGKFARVLSGQAGYVGLNEYPLQFEDNYKKFDYLAIAPYFGFGVKAESGWTVNNALDALEDALEDGIKQISDNVALANKYNVSIIGYEGSQHLIPSANGPVTQAQAHQLFTQVNAHPRIGTMYAQYLNAWKNLTRGAIMNHFSHTGGWSVYGYWGSKEYMTSSNDNYPKAKALYEYSGGSPVRTLTTNNNGGGSTDSTSSNVNSQISGLSGGTNSSRASLVFPSILFATTLVFALCF